MSVRSPCWKGKGILNILPNPGKTAGTERHKCDTMKKIHRRWIPSLKSGCKRKNVAASWTKPQNSAFSELFGIKRKLCVFMGRTVVFGTNITELLKIYGCLHKNSGVCHVGFVFLSKKVKYIWLFGIGSVEYKYIYSRGVELRKNDRPRE